jgi:aspartate carbamoyltransferase catalytic subunit
MPLMKINHLLNARDLDVTLVEHFISRANELLKAGKFPQWSEKFLCMFFAENSTRTRISFEIAAKKINAHVINFDLQSSSLRKNESYFDTFENLVQMGIRLFVLRHSEELFPQLIAEKLNTRAIIINAGDGCHEHPSQALLDVMTIAQTYSKWEKLKVAIIGDILHSRVAHSLCHLLLTLGVEDIRLAGPKDWLPENAIHPRHVNCMTNCRQAIEGADVIVTLRIQKERLHTQMQMNLQEYFHAYGIDSNKLKLASKNAIVLHPGPLNRGIEIADDVADGSQAKILQQVRNGVMMRIAIMDYLFKCQNS